VNYNPKHYNRKPIRLKEFDYSTPWWYYVTICTKDFRHWFGNVNRRAMKYNAIGNIAVRYFEEIPKHF
jgi:hypothetical protein